MPPLRIHHRSCVQSGRSKPWSLRRVSRQAIASDKNGTKPAASVPTKDFTCPDGTVIQVMACDYGFRSGSGRMYEDQYGEVPGSIFQLASKNFSEEWLNLRRAFVNDEFKDISEARKGKGFLGKLSTTIGNFFVRGAQAADKALVNANALESVDVDEEAQQPMTPEQVKRKLDALTLDAQRVATIEEERFVKSPPNAPWTIKIPYQILCFMLDFVYEGRPIQRFWVLEEVARMPYFAYISMLHLYETFGWWRAGAALRKVHFAEEWNELHHLQIMESLGGDNAWFDRFFAFHSAIVYYWALILFYAFSPKYAYLFSELIEGHAVDTYDVFAQENKGLLEKLPPPAVAVSYYRGSDVYMFHSFQTSPEAQANPRKPECNSLFDVFCNIRDDEKEHAKTMVACQDPATIAKEIQNAKIPASK